MRAADGDRVPLARWSLPDLHREVLARGVVATISGTTLSRWLDADAIRPWRYRSWLFPRDPRFAKRAKYEYRRRGGAYPATWDVQRARPFGRCERRFDIAPFDRLVDDVMTEEPFRSAGEFSGFSTT